MKNFLLLICGGLVLFHASIVMATEPQQEKGLKYKDFSFEPTWDDQWTEGRYGGRYSVGDEFHQNTINFQPSTVEKEIWTILDKKNHWFDNFEVLGYARINPKKVIARVNFALNGTPDKVPQFDVEKGKVSFHAIFAIFDLEEKSYSNIWESSDMRAGGDFRGRESYGCVQNLPVFKMDMNLDGIQDYFLLSAWSDGDYMWIDESIKLHMYDGNTFKELINIELLKQVYSIGFKGDADFGQPQVGDESSFAKLYIMDFDQDDKLDILVWRRHYYISPDSERELVFDREEFLNFEESENKFVLTAKNTIEIKKQMKERKLTWSKGFPSQDRCSPASEKMPSVKYVNDPVLKQ